MYFREGRGWWDLGQLWNGGLTRVSGPTRGLIYPRPCDKRTASPHRTYVYLQGWRRDEFLAEAMPLNSLVTVQRGDSCGRIAKNPAKTVAQNTILRSEIFFGI